MFFCKRYSDAVRMAMFFHDLKVKRYLRVNPGKTEADILPNTGWYSALDNWRHYMPHEGDRMMAKMFPADFPDITP